MKFANWTDMYNYLTHQGDLYNKETGEYVFQYNDAGALCRYHLEKEEVESILEKMKETEEDYWGAFLGTGGEVLDSVAYDDFRYSKDVQEKTLYLLPSFDYCKEMYYKDDWEDTRTVTVEMLNDSQVEEEKEI